jgi:hypothetical protein
MMLTGLKRRVARRIAYWLVASRAADEREAVWEGVAGRRHARIVRLASTPCGKRAIRWLIRAGEFQVPPPHH